MAEDPGFGGCDSYKETTAVQSIGNSWIVCRSKSYSNRIYYFNTLSGKSAWNLSEAEKRKAKQRTLEDSNDNCPEPREPPFVLPNKDRNTIENEREPSKLYNKQLNNTQLSRQPTKFSSSTSHHCSNCLTLNPMSEPVVNIPIPINHQAWAFPPSCQMFNAKNVGSIGENMGISRNVDFNNYVNRTAYRIPAIHDISTSLSKHYNSGMEPHFMEKYSNQYYQKNNNYKNGSFSARNEDNKMNIPCKIRDLREVLSKKEHINEHRRRFPSNQHECQKASQKPLQGECGSDTLMSKDYDEEDSSDEEWLRVNAPEGRLYSDLAVFRNLASSNVVTRPWYIVAGFDVLLKSLKILDVLISSDDECTLVVPEAVRLSIQATCRDVNLNSVKQARIAMRQLDQWFNSGRVTTRRSDKHSLIEPEDLSSCILNCCLNLLEQKYHVILLCSKKEKYKYINVTCLSTLTIKEVKEMLTIKISNEISKLVKSFKKRLIPDVLITNQTTGKETLHTGVQTEFTICDQLDVTDVINNHARANNKKNNLCEKETTHTYINDRSKPMEINILPKRRTLKLPFNVPNSKSNANINNGKAFKWRRRRNLPDSQNTTIKTNATKQTESKRTNLLNDSVNNNNIDKMLCLNQSNDVHISHNQIQSSVNFDENVENEKKITEESSTSGFISNSVSNADCDYVLVGNCENVGGNRKHIFEVTDFVMEKSLRMRSDEWVSRFAQIMKEVLTIALLRDPTILNPSPPPWTLIEATDCITVRYKDKDIKDAGYRLLEILNKGNVDLNMKLEHYMEMYSHGVYLIESLQNVLHDVFDLQAAKESLSNLLNEIRNASSEPAHIYSFTDTTNTLPDKIPQTDIREGSETAAIQRNKDAKNNELVDVQQISPAGCDWSPVKLNSCTNKTLFENNVNDENECNQANFITQVDESEFFYSLCLQKTFSKGTSLKKHSDKPESNQTVSKRKTAPNIYNYDAIVNLGEKQSDHLANLNSIKEHTVESKSMKTLTRVENILKKKLVRKKYVSYKESDCYEYYSDNEHCKYRNCNDDNDGNNGTGVNCDDKNVYDENNNLERVIKNTVYEIKEAYLRAHEFCEKTCEELNSPVVSDDKKKEIEEKATVAYKNISNLCSSLKSINEREKSELNRGFGNTGIVLNKTGAENRTELIEYRDIVTKFENQGKLLLESLSLILDAIN